PPTSGVGAPGTVPNPAPPVPVGPVVTVPGAIVDVAPTATPNDVLPIIPAPQSPVPSPDAPVLVADAVPTAPKAPAKVADTAEVVAPDTADDDVEPVPAPHVPPVAAAS